MTINITALAIIKLIVVIVRFLIVTVAYSIVTILILDLIEYVVRRIRRKLQARKAV